MNVFGSVLLCVLISLIWGVTNVLIKRSTTEITKVTGTTWHNRLLNEVIYLLKNWNYLLAFGINQVGSVLFYLALLVGDISLVVPVTNSLTFVVTSLTAIFFGERVPNKGIIWGSILVVIGTSCCVLDKTKSENL